MGIYITTDTRLDSICKYFEPLMLLFTIAVSVDTFIVLLSGERFISMGGSTYQTASYIVAFIYGINVHFLIRGEHHIRFEFMKTNVYRKICYILLLIQILAVLISGGRGGMVLIAIYSLQLLIYNIKNSKNAKRILKNITIPILFFSLIYLLLNRLLEIPSFSSSFQRVFSYISNEGIDW